LWTTAVVPGAPPNRVSAVPLELLLLLLARALEPNAPVKPTDFCPGTSFRFFSNGA
jgi:hypothetical protein